MQPDLKKDKEVKVPIRVKREIKDLVEPIVLRRTMLWRVGIGLGVLVVLGLVTWFAFFRAPSGDALLADAVDAAGGMEAWKTVQGGTYTRIHTFFDENEQPIKEVVERHAFRYTDGRIVMETTSDNGVARIGRDSKGYWATLNGNEAEPEVLAREMDMMCESDECTPTCSMELAFYRISMPFKLTDPGVLATYGGAATLGGRAVSLLHIGFEEGVGSDRWTLYIDDDTKLIRKIDYYENADLDAVDTPPQEIFWSDHRPAGNLILSHRQTYYRSNGTKLEEYVIKDVDFASPVPDERFAHTPQPRLQTTSSGG